MGLTIFTDTNIWFSALYGSDNCEKILKAHLAGRVKIMISEGVLTELIRTVKTKAPHTLKTLEKLLKISPPIISRKVVNVPRKYLNLADGKDLPILLAAHEAGVKIFVTGNIKDFNQALIEKKFGIKIITPKQAVQLLNL